MLSTFRVLVLDNNPVHCKRVQDLLSSAGFTQVDITHDTTDALRIVQHRGYDLIVLEIQTPGMDGAQLIHEIAERNLTPMLAIITNCSHRLANSVGLMAKEHGFAVVGTFMKPFCHEHAENLASTLLTNTELDFSAELDHDVGVLNLFDRESLVNALNNRSIRACFQPKKSLKTGNIVGAEGLVRWQHRELGLLMPKSFLPALRNFDLDYDLLTRMLVEGVNAYHVWRGQGYRIPISINLPAFLLERDCLPDDLHKIVIQYGIPPADVTFELLEDDTPINANKYFMATSRLRLKGFGLSQDDFGKGYSSMCRLVSTPFTELKIDRELVCGSAKDEVRGAAFISSVLLGKQLGLKVTAEGIEDMTDLQFARDIGCDNAQGFLISAAVDVSDFGRLLSNGPKSYIAPTPTQP